MSLGESEEFEEFVSTRFGNFARENRMGAKKQTLQTLQTSLTGVQYVYGGWLAE
jgi:hypothetical protein